jgi:hypothetical protein
VPVHEIRQGVMAVCLHVHVQPDGRPGKTQQVGRIIKIPNQKKEILEQTYSSLYNK